jgi:hypothetical protein
VKAVCAIDLGIRELKLLESDGRRVTRHAEVIMPDGALVDGVPTQLLATAIRSVMEDDGFTATRVRVAIAETGTAFRDFRLPPIPSSELSSAVMFEGRRLVPMDASDVYFAWHASRDQRGYAVFLVAARRDMIDALIGVLSAAGLLVERIDLKPLALARGMGLSDGLLLEWASSEATLVLMAGGRPRFFRTFQLDAAPDDLDGQLDELVLSVNALVRFVRGSAPDVQIGAGSVLSLAGRFAFLEDGGRRAQERFPFKTSFPAGPAIAPADLPWQAHLAGLGLLEKQAWHNRLTPSQGGDIRVAA